MEGWDTYYVGATTPTTSILRTLADRKADVLAISATMTFHVRAVAQLIAEVRASKACGGVHILVGGYPFNVSPDLWRQVNASGYASDAQQAVQVAKQWISDQA
jgi:methanogenic corrinoid protein MtbC1